jgi:hypothetical protein
MKKQTLEEQVSRIKGMMGKIMTESFDESTPTEKPQGPSEEAQQLANKILSSVANSSDVNAEMENAGHYGSEVYVPLTDEEGNLLEYTIDIFVTSSSSFTPGRSFMSNGDVGYPDEGEGAEYEFGGVTLSVQTADGQEIYGGKDFTNIFDFEFSDGSKMEDLLFEKFDDSIREWESERD